FFCDRPILAVGHFLRVSQDLRDLARDPGGGPELCHPPVPHFKLSWALAGRHAVRDDLDAAARIVPQDLETEAGDVGCYGKGRYCCLCGGTDQPCAPWALD